MIIFNETIQLSNENIATICDSCTAAYERYAGKRRKSTMNLSLTIEELLLECKFAYGENAECRVVGIKRFGAIHFEIINHGNAINPLECDQAMTEYSISILERLGLRPSYSYNHKRGDNVIFVNAPLKPIKNKMIYEIIGGVILAFVCYMIINMLPGNMAKVIGEEVVAPIFKKMTDIITELATPLVFLAVIDGIIGMGNTSTLGSVGKKLVSNMFLSYGIAAIAFTALAVMVFPVSTIGAAAGQGILGQLIQLVLDIIPSNLLNCFVIDNDLQVIVCAVFIGFTLLTLGDTTSKFANGVRTLSLLVNKMMSIACKLLPLIVFLGVLNMMLMKIAGVTEIYKSILVFVGSAALVILSLFIRVKLVAKVSIRKLFKAQVETILVNLTTSSQVASLPANTRCCKGKFGIQEKLVDFSLPICIVAYMPCGAAFLGLTAWGVSSIAQTPMDITAIIKIAIISVIIAIAAPPIPGSAFAVMPILFSSCGIDMAYYSIAIIMGTVIGYFLPAFNGFCMQLEVLITAKKLNLVDEEKLKLLQ